jgi:hypothetical protein
VEDSLRDEAVCLIFLCAPLQDFKRQTLFEARSCSQKNYFFSKELRKPFIILFALRDTFDLTGI